MNTKLELHFTSIANTAAVACAGVSQAAHFSGGSATFPRK